VASVSGARYQSAFDIAVTVTVTLTLSADLPQAPNHGLVGTEWSDLLMAHPTPNK
jgi:hypothetical protein